jgi:hypothetical protein
MRADISSKLLSRESNLRVVNNKKMPAIKSETIREGGAFNIDIIVIE